eukprot:jgi/Botrbrau1/11533/Bobra.0393s0012.1
MVIDQPQSGYYSSSCTHVPQESVKRHRTGVTPSKQSPSLPPLHRCPPRSTSTECWSWGSCWLTSHVLKEGPGVGAVTPGRSIARLSRVSKGKNVSCEKSCDPVLLLPLSSDRALLSVLYKSRTEMSSPIKQQPKTTVSSYRSHPASSQLATHSGCKTDSFLYHKEKLPEEEVCGRGRQEAAGDSGCHLQSGRWWGW